MFYVFINAVSSCRSFIILFQNMKVFARFQTKSYLICHLALQGSITRHLQQWPCYLQGPEFESHLRSLEFSACKKVSPLKKHRIPMLRSVPCALSRVYVKHPTKKKQKNHHPKIRWKKKQFLTRSSNK